MTDFNTAFRAACAAVGVIDKNVPANGQWYATDLVDDPRGRGDGRIMLFADGNGGVVWNHKTGNREYFFIKSTWRNELTLEQREERIQQRLRQEAQRKKRQERAAKQANTLWQFATPCLFHPYLATKHVRPHGTRLSEWRRKYRDDAGKWRQVIIKNALLIPMYNEAGLLVSLQAIFPKESPELGRGKDFLPGGKLNDVFWWIGQKTVEAVCVAEGFATAATIYEQTGYRTYIAFTANNLLSVGHLIRKNLPEAKIIFCADNDEKTAGNPGLTKANEAAAAVNGFIAVPPVPGDFNDYAAMLGEV